jgi:hypothetical protein
VAKAARFYDAGATRGKGSYQCNLETLFGEKATAEVLRFIENTEVGRPPVKEENREDYWDIE